MTEANVSATPTWHAVDAAAVVAEVATDPQRGLSEDEARGRLLQHGPNRLAEVPPPHPLLRFARQFHHLLIYVLLGAAGITALLAQWVDSGVIVAVVLLNAVVGFIQEGKAERSLQAIRHLLAPRAQVLRDGRQHDADAADLVPGDVVLLASGDRVPADVRLLQTRNLRVDEAALTGESVPVDKNAEAVAVDAAIGDRLGMAYAGTLVTQGQARAVVVATAQRTEIGRIGRLLETVEAGPTPLLRKMAAFGRMLTFVILALAAALFAFGTWVRGYAAADMFMAAVGLAVAAIPEGLPAIMTITLAIGVQRMAARHGHHPPPARGGDAGVGDGDLFGQDRHPDAQRDDRPGGRRRRSCLHGRRCWLRAARRVARGDGRRAAAPCRAPARAGQCPVQRRRPARARRAVDARGRPDRRRVAHDGDESRRRPGCIACSASAAGCRAVRVRTSLHGHLAPRIRRRCSCGLCQGCTRTPAADVRGAARPAGEPAGAGHRLLAVADRRAGARRAPRAGPRPGGSARGTCSAGACRRAARSDAVGAGGHHRSAARRGRSGRGAVPRGRHRRKDDHRRPCGHGRGHRRPARPRR